MTRTISRTEGGADTSRSRTWALAAAAVLALIVIAGIVVATGGEPQTAGVNWHAQQESVGNTGPVEGASATLERGNNGISYEFNATSLTPGNAYTLWLVVVNNPSACAVTPCVAGEIINNPATDSQVRFAAGHLAGGSGRGTFAGHVSEGPLSGWLTNRALIDAHGAEIHLVVNDHGPALPEYMPDMIRTYRGGCSNASPFPPPFPASALADGEVGPNICRLFQAAVFLP